MSALHARRPLRAALLGLSTVALTLGATPAASAQSLSFGGAPAPAGTVQVNQAPAPAPATTSPTAQDISRVAPAYAEVVAGIYNGTNRERAAAGAPAVKLNVQLQDIAQNWSEQMAAEDTMYHNPQIRNLMNTTFPGMWRAFGENVLQNWSDATADQLVQQWMDSPPHRLNLLNPTHTDLGVGLAVAPSGKLYATQNFARLVG